MGVNSLANQFPCSFRQRCPVHSPPGSPHHSHHLHSHHLSLAHFFTPDLKPICSTNPFLRSLSDSFGLPSQLLLNEYGMIWSRTRLAGHWCLFYFNYFFRFWLRVPDKLTTLSFLVPVRLSYRIG